MNTINTYTEWKDRLKMSSLRTQQIKAATQRLQGAFRSLSPSPSGGSWRGGKGILDAIGTKRNEGLAGRVSG